MRDGFGQDNMRDALRFLDDLRYINKEVRRLIYRAASLTQEEITDLSRLVEKQARMVEQEPIYFSARERFRIDEERLTAMLLLREAIKFLKEIDPETKIALPGGP
jgi:hypothetical protein